MTGKLVLIVEDEPDSLDICSTLLRHHGYEVLVATSGEEAVALARQRRPDAIIMDVMLPGADGWATTARLKGSAETARIPVIVLTVRAMEPDREKSFEAGADSFLAKPAEPRHLLEEVQRFIGPAGPAA
ncbi:MAG TPA: response regulator [Longimicrobiaceae bacterium]|nr:response regulator [Longimicrobiaceae bacterium]